MFIIQVSGVNQGKQTRPIHQTEVKKKIQKPNNSNNTQWACFYKQESGPGEACKQVESGNDETPVSHMRV